MIITNEGKLADIKAIHDNSFPFPENVNMTKYVIDNGVLVAAGMVKLTTEGILIIDKTLPGLTRVRAVKGLIESMIPEIRKLGINDCHVFVKNESMRRFLKEFWFQDCIGNPMVINF